MTDDTASRLAEFVRLVADGYSQRSAARVAGVSRETIHRLRRTKPEFASALHAAERSSREIRAEQRDDDYREKVLALALDASDKEYQKPLTKREKRVWYRWQGAWPDSAIPPGDDKFSQLVATSIRQKQQAAFAERAKLKAAGLAGNPADSSADPPLSGTPRKAKPAADNIADSPAEPPPSKKTGVARTLW